MFCSRIIGCLLWLKPITASIGDAIPDRLLAEKYVKSWMHPTPVPVRQIVSL